VSDLSLYFQELVSGKRHQLRDRALLFVLRFFSHPYALVLRLRAGAFRLGLMRSYRLPCPVISVGNITLGGTGKTPTVAWIADYLMRRGKRVAVLSRGYGGSARGELRVVSDGTSLLLPPEVAGDEPCLLAAKLPGLQVVIGADRYQAGLRALAELKPDLVVLDDGFQHLRLRRDLNILLLDAGKPFAAGWTLPGGLLREPVSAAGRADLVVYTRCPEGAPGPDLFPDKPSCWTKHRFSGIVPLAGGAAVSFDAASTSRVMAFSGIADPESFFSGLEGIGVKPVTTISFPDHAPYGEAEVAAILRLKVASRSTLLLTTQKDAVKLLPYADRLAGCFAVELELEFRDATPLERALDRLLP
jgi:tetraacyldisaccharide 4'-kinase